ncbi:pyruvate dehydrogenase complex dihydrolipoamide acetyltransferase [Thermaurantiacus sp.]
MPIDVTMPALSPTMEAGTLAKWLVKVGDTVRPGDVIAEIETDKATMEVEAVDAGEVLELLVPEGAEGVPVNAVIARLRGQEEPPPGAVPEATAPPPEATAPPLPAADRSSHPPAPAENRILATPLARRLAQSLGVDLAKLVGTGPGGRIVKADVEAAAGRTPQPGVLPAPVAAPSVAGPPETPLSAPAAGPPEPGAPPVAAPAPAPALPADAPFETVRLSNMRRTIARRLAEAKSTVPHFYLTVDCRIDALLKLRAELNAALEPRGIRLSVNDLLVKALGLALEAVPDANVSFAGDHLRRFARADVSVAVAVPGGLITPVIRDAAGKRLAAIATEMKALAARAREGKLKPEEYSGGTASLSNLGMYGVKQFDAVINPPEGLIVAVGAAEPRPWVADGALAVATVMTVTGSFDHRAIDGAVGAQFLAAFRALIEAPMAMLA